MSEADTNKTVFISYRRDVSSFIARAVFMDLRSHGYDVFMDVESIDSGAFAGVILNQIEARAHFVLILTPGSVERCSEPDDWLRREIETAIDLKRNIVPLFVNNFDLKENAPNLTGKLAEIMRFNALNVPYDYFDEAMSRLRTRFLKQPLQGAIKIAPIAEQQIAEQKIVEAISKPSPTREQLSAEEYFERGYQHIKSKDYEEAIEYFTDAVNLNPEFDAAFYNRGVARRFRDDIEGAIQDFSSAVRLNIGFRSAFFARALAYYDSQQWANAIIDCSRVIELNPKSAESYNNRAECYFAIGEYGLALSDFERTNEMKHAGDHYAIAGIAVTQHALGNVEKAQFQWKSLLLRNKNYRDLVWVKEQLHWAEPLVNEARKLIETLDS